MSEYWDIAEMPCPLLPLDAREERMATDGEITLQLPANVAALYDAASFTEDEWWRGLTFYKWLDWRWPGWREELRDAGRLDNDGDVRARLAQRAQQAFRVCIVQRLRDDVRHGHVVIGFPAGPRSGVARGVTLDELLEVTRPEFLFGGFRFGRYSWDPPNMPDHSWIWQPHRDDPPVEVRVYTRGRFDNAAPGRPRDPSTKTNAIHIELLDMQRDADGNLAPLKQLNGSRGMKTLARKLHAEYPHWDQDEGNIDSTARLISRVLDKVFDIK